MPNKIEIGKRLREFIKKKYSTIAEFAEAMDRDKTFFTPYFSGKSIPGGEILAKLRDLGCDINWLLTGIKGSANVYLYPILSEVYAAEDTELLDPEKYDEHAQFSYFKKDHKCYALRVSGDSMETILKDGDIVLVDIDEPFLDGNMVVVKLANGKQFVKRYYNMGDEWIRLSSDNDRYHDKMISKKDVEIIHKVVKIEYTP
ncbi:XRE family transcriptional regulator [Bacteroidota bacterium]